MDSIESVTMNSIMPTVNEEPPKVVVATATSKKLKYNLPVLTAGYLNLSRSLQFVELFGIVIGLKTTYDWKIDIRFVFTKFITAFVWSQFFYTKYLYINQHNVVKTLEVFAMYGMGVSAILKIWVFDNFHENMCALFKSTLLICQQNTGSRADRVNRRVKSNFVLLKLIASIAIILVTTYMFYPVKSFLFDGLLVPFLPIELMFIDQSTMWGYCFTSCIMITVGFYAIVGAEYLVLTFVFLIINYSPRVDILQIDIEELDELWSDTSTSKLAYRHLFLKNICRKYTDMREYIAEIKNIFDVKMFIFFVFAYLSQILCLYQIRVNNWIPGYAIALGFFIEMILYCLMGTKVEIEIIKSIYTYYTVMTEVI